jgi:predicted RNA-binding Zn ribbon-like protein
VFQAEDDPVALAVSLANTWDTLEDPPELLHAHVLERFAAVRGLECQVTRREVTAARAVREQLRLAFSADDEATAVTILNAVLPGRRATRELVRDETKWRFRYVGPIVDVIAVESAESLLDAIRIDGWERFGVCDAAPCCCVFVDRSRNRTRRFCSELCANRYAQAQHRRRRQSRK